MPGMGPMLGAEFIATADLSGYRDAGRLASHAGRAPVPRDFGPPTGAQHRPQRYNRRLRWVFYMSSQTAMTRPGPSRDHCLKKWVEGMKHAQALLALAHRRVNVLSAMLRNNRLFISVPPVTQSA
jgi:transposase